MFESANKVCIGLQFDELWNNGWQVLAVSRVEVNEKGVAVLSGEGRAKERSAMLL